MNAIITESTKSALTLSNMNVLRTYPGLQPTPGTDAVKRRMQRSPCGIPSNTARIRERWRSYRLSESRLRQKLNVINNALEKKKHGNVFTIQMLS